MDLSDVSPEQLRASQDMLNERPRKKGRFKNQLEAVFDIRSWTHWAEDFAGAFIEHVLMCARLLRRDQREVGALGAIMANAVVLVFAGGALPRAVGMTEEDLELEVVGEKLVFECTIGHLKEKLGCCHPFRQAGLELA